MPEEPNEVLATLCVLFGLRHNEGLLLLSLMTHGFRTHDQLRAVIAQEVVSSSTMSVTLSTLRRKLKPRSIEITNISKIGYTLAEKSRAKILKFIEEYNATIMPHEPKAPLSPDAA
jgi:DNA-binding winged helix-turn-helix (wHTH) protein